MKSINYRKRNIVFFALIDTDFSPCFAKLRNKKPTHVGKSDSLEELFKMQVEVLRNIYLNDRVISTFIIELWAEKHGKTFKEGMKRYNELFKSVQGQWEAYIHAKHGSVSLEDLLPKEPPIEP